MKRLITLILTILTLLLLTAGIALAGNDDIAVAWAANMKAGQAMTPGGGFITLSFSFSFPAGVTPRYKLELRPLAGGSTVKLYPNPDPDMGANADPNDILVSIPAGTAYGAYEFVLSVRDSAVSSEFREALTLKVNVVKDVNLFGWTWMDEAARARCYFNYNGNILTDWNYIDGKWYYFYTQQANGKAIGQMATGSAVQGTGDNEKIYYFNPNYVEASPADYGAVLTGAQNHSGAYYYHKPSTPTSHNGEALLKQWIADATGAYYAGSDGRLYANAIVEIANSRYFFNANATLATGWARANGFWRYFAPTGAADGTLGKMYTSTWCTVSGKDYFLNANGEMLTGQQNINGVVYLLHATNGDLIKGWQKINNIWYYLLQDYSLGRGMNMRKTGWLQDTDGKYYYLNPSNAGAMMTGWIKIDSTYYYLNASGAAAQTGWQKLSNIWYYFKGSPGVMQTGWQLVGGKWYFMQTDGKMLTGWITVKNKLYLLSSSGAMVEGWYKDSKGKWFYLIPTDGNAVVGWKQVKGVWYYFDAGSKIMAANAWIQDGGKWYYLKSTGAMATGSLKIGSKTYQFNSSGACLNP